METINPHACREGFEQQRKAGINVDWFTWQIAWHDAMFTQVDCAPPPASTNRLTVTPAMVKAAMPWLSNLHHMRKADKESNVEEALRAALAIIAATEAK